MKKHRIVFMGTPAFAVPALQSLIDSGANLTGIVTQPDRPVGRGQRLKQSPIKELAVKYTLPVLQPGARAEWQVVVKAVKAGDVRFKVEMTSDQLSRPVEETEATNLY